MTTPVKRPPPSGDAPQKKGGPDLAEAQQADAVESRDEFLTSQEVRCLLKIGRTKLWELTKKQALPAYRVGDGRTATLRYKRSELLEWLERNRVGSDSAA